jgi:hypothetical protein
MVQSSGRVTQTRRSSKHVVAPHLRRPDIAVVSKDHSNKLSVKYCPPIVVIAYRMRRCGGAKATLPRYSGGEPITAAIIDHRIALWHDRPLPITLSGGRRPFSQKVPFFPHLHFKNWHFACLKLTRGTITASVILLFAGAVRVTALLALS